MGWFQTSEEPIAVDSPEERLVLRLREEGIEVREHAVQLRELSVKSQAEELEQRSQRLVERSQILAEPECVEVAIVERLRKLELAEDRLRDSQRRLSQWEESLAVRQAEITRHEQMVLRGAASPLAVQRSVKPLLPSHAPATGGDFELPSVRLAKRNLPVATDVAIPDRPETIEMSLDPPVQGAYLKFQEATTRTPLAAALPGARPRRRGRATHAANLPPDLEATDQRIHHLNSDPLHLGLAREVALLRKGMLDMEQKMQSGTAPTRDPLPVPMVPMSLPAEEPDDGELLPQDRSLEFHPGSVVLW